MNYVKEFDSIKVNYSQLGKEKWVEASCPYCGYATDKMYIHSADIGPLAAQKMKVIQANHADKSS